MEIHALLKSFRVVAFAAAISGCGSATTVPTATTEAPKVHTAPFDLYTHCGINELTVNGKYFQRVGGPLSDGSGNPPSGWGNPYQHGTLSVSGDIVIFRDDLGHAEKFKVRSGATGFLMICS